MRCAALKLHRRRKYFQASSLEVDSDTLPLSCIIKRTAPHPGICRGVFLQSSKGEPLRWRISNVHERIVPGIEGRWQYIVAPCFKDLSEFVAFSTTVHHCVEDESEVGPRHYRYCPAAALKEASEKEGRCENTTRAEKASANTVSFTSGSELARK